MSIYSKLAHARVKLQEKELKKSGRNKFSNYDYFELKDFLPEINRIFAELGLCGVVSYTQELATLTIFDANSEQKIEFSSPMAEATLKGCHAIQNLGAVETYQRRYLYMTALEIVEGDVLDENTGNPEYEPKQSRSSQKQATQIDNNPQVLLDTFLTNAKKAQSFEQLKNEFGKVFKLLPPEMKQEAKDFYDIRKAEFEQENE